MNKALALCQKLMAKNLSQSMKIREVMALFEYEDVICNFSVRATRDSLTGTPGDVDWSIPISYEQDYNLDYQLRTSPRTNIYH